MRAACLAVLAALSCAAWAERPQDAQAWLAWMAQSATRTNYSGIFVHQQSGRIETSRVVHLVNEGGEVERVVSLDGPPREIIRTDNEVRCIFPEKRLVKIDRVRGKRFFPALLSPSQDLTESYTARLEGTDRVAGYECQIVVLEPRDQFRYGHRFCAELTSGLMLRATLIAEGREAVEQFTFTQLALGDKVDKEQIKALSIEPPAGWQREDSRQRTQTEASGWWARSLPAGFRKIFETQRTLAGRPLPVVHQVYSDGLASVSVFIESAQGGGRGGSGAIQHAGHQLYVRSIPDQPYTITAVGEVPSPLLERIANSLSAAPK